MAVSGIQGHVLEVTVVGCHKLKDTEWISRQDPYVCLEYGTTKVRTRTHTDGGKNPSFQQKFVFSLIEGLRELTVVVWNSNTLTFDDFIGNGKVQLQKVLSTGYDDNLWPLKTKTGRYAGEVKLIMHYANANKQHGTSIGPSAPPYSVPPLSQPSPYAPPPPASSPYPPPPSAYPAASHYPSYPSNSVPTAYPPYSTPSYSPSPYPPSAYPPPPSGAYPPPPSGAYPPPPSGAYPPPPSGAYPPPPAAYPPIAYPPPPHGSHPSYPPPGGHYPR